MSVIKSQRSSELAKIIIRTFAILSFDLGCVMAGACVGIFIADQAAGRMNIGIDISSPSWNAEPAILFGLVGFLAISVGGVFITHRLLHAVSDHVAYWALPLILTAFFLLLVILQWRLHFDAGIWQT